MADDAPFARDFGYLGPFLQKVEAHARGLPESQARAELLQILAGAPERWARIQALLSGAQPAAPQDEGGAGAGPPDPPAPDAPEAAPPPRAHAWGWSVGSLAEGGGGGAPRDPRWTVGSLIREKG